MIAGLESRYGAGTATMLTFYTTSLECKPWTNTKRQNPSTSTSSLYFASLPQMTAFQFYGPENSFADPNNQNQYCYFDENGIEHLSGAVS